MHAVVLDMDRAEGIAVFAEHTRLNVLIDSAGVMRFEELDRTRDLADAEATITTNLLGPIRLTDALVEHLSRRPDAALVNVTSGLAFVPLTAAPTYSATRPPSTATPSRCGRCWPARPRSSSWSRTRCRPT